jgi:MFS family permease
MLWQAHLLKEPDGLAGYRKIQKEMSLNSIRKVPRNVECPGTNGRAPIVIARQLGGGTRLRRLGIAIIVISQWLGTSLWFSPSGATQGLSQWLRLDPAEFGWLLAATQLGFIFGTFISAVTAAADRFPPERVFALSALAGAALNSVWWLSAPSMTLVWFARFGVGVALAGIYPVGMKMLVQRVNGNAGHTLGVLVAMLTLGTAMPQILQALGGAFPWQAVIWSASALATAAAVLVSFVPQPGSSLPARKTARAAGLWAAPSLLQIPAYRAASFGYFGHMWELYAFWSVVPLLVATIVTNAGVTAVAALSAAVIAAGSLGCTFGGALSTRFGSRLVAAVALGSSGVLCILYPLLSTASFSLKFGALAAWSFFVVADSPHFSAMASQAAPANLIGTALTSMNCVGFALTAISIVAVQTGLSAWGESALWLLAPGPLLGLIAMWPLLRTGRLKRPTESTHLGAGIRSRKAAGSFAHPVTRSNALPGVSDRWPGRFASQSTDMRVVQDEVNRRPGASRQRQPPANSSNHLH